jgi:hypothetical protein
VNIRSQQSDESSPVGWKDKSPQKKKSLKHSMMSRIVASCIWRFIHIVVIVQGRHRPSKPFMWSAA